MNRAVYRYLFQTYGRQSGVWIGFAGEVVSGLFLRVWVGVIMAQIAAHLTAGNIAAAQRSILTFFIVYVLGAMIGAVTDLVAVRAENEQYGRLTTSFYMRLTGKDMSFYRDHQTGYLAGLFRQHLDGMMLLVRLLRSDITGVVVSLVAPVVVLLFASWPVGLVALAIIVLQLVYVLWASAQANSYRQRAHEIYRKITGEAADEITNIVAYKSGGKERHAEGNMARLAKQETTIFWLRRRIAVLLDLPRSVITALGMTVAFFIVVSGPHDSQAVGLVVLTLTYMFQIMRNVYALPGLIVQHDDNITKVYPTLQYLANDYELIRDPVRPKAAHIHSGAIEVSHVAFRYPGRGGESAEINVFNDLTISIAGGEQVGVVGLSGAGKSTLASLLMRFDDVTDGSIRIDGIDLRHMRQSDLRQHIAYVPQEPLLFHRSVRENIAYFREDATEAEVIRAAKAAHSHESIEKLPAGYDTMVGERGLKLSGGQKQRVVIARAIIKDAPIMIFDEATSALDSESEQIIQRALPEILGKRTAVIIAHRLSTVAGLDRIIVMHDGKVSEQGTHAELLAHKGRYYSLWQKQVGGEI